MDETCEYLPTFPSLILQAIDPPFVTINKPLSYKMGKTFHEGLK